MEIFQYIGFMSHSRITAVALSGGVDSSVAALLLHKEGGPLVGASHFIWPDSRCCSDAVFERARGLSRRLGIAYYRVDLAAEFRKAVVDDFITAYLAGKTPNPCVVCNRVVRFDLFYDALRGLLTAEGLLAAGGGLRFCTGHYARIRRAAGGCFLRKAKDPDKDQSYMLYGIDRERLEKFHFPLGELLKSEVMDLAAEAGLDYSGIGESQDACFVADDYADFIVEQTGRNDLLTPGEIVDRRGNVLGRHRGSIRYTVGQRRGLGLGSGPWYVVEVDPQANQLVVARQSEAGRRSLEVGSLNWFIDPLMGPLSCRVKLRYQSRDTACRIDPLPEGRVRVELENPEIVTPGQSAVFYGDDLVLGGGIIR
jgi:tRNA-specific 2-thiouridylase